MIKVEISNIKDINADVTIEVSGKSEVIYNELLQLFTQLMSNDESYKILNAALRKTVEVFINDKDK